MVPHKRGNKQYLSTFESNPNADILLDTTTRLIDATKACKQVYDILEHKLSNSLCLDDSAKEDDDTFSSKHRHVAKSELHKVVAQPKLMP